MKTYNYDVVIVGSGCAGYACADWLADFGVKSVAIVTEGVNVGTSRNTGSDKQTYYKLALSGEDEDSVYKMAKTLYEGGAMDGDVALSESANSVRAFIKLNNLGVNFPTNQFGEYVGYKTDHDPCRRATSIGPYTSRRMTEVLQQSVRAKGVDVIDLCQVIEVLVDKGRATGVLGLDLSDTTGASFIAIKSNYVVLATGGPACVYYDSVYPVGHTGSSSLAINAGAEMRNLAEWQYGLASTDFRWNVSGTYQQVLPRYISVDGNGVEREFLLDYFPTPAEALKNVFLKGYEWPFDVRKIYGSSFIDLIVYHETKVLGRSVYMDFTKEPTGLGSGFSELDSVTLEYLKNSDALIPLPIERLRKMNPGAIELYRSHGIDLSRQPLKIAVCAQHNNGGVSVDKDRQTTVTGLYAVGEVAGTLGIFRPGGSALNACQTGALCSAKHIAYQAQNKASDSFEDTLSDAVSRLGAVISATKGENSTLRSQRERYQRSMSKSFAFLRNLSEMDKTLGVIEEDCKQFTKLNKWSDAAEIPQLFKNHDLITTARLVAKSISFTAREFGSRGSAMVIDSSDFMQRQALAENESGRKKVVCIRADASPEIYTKEVKPIPKSEQWFEKVWSEHRATTEGR